MAPVKGCHFCFPLLKISKTKYPCCKVLPYICLIPLFASVYEAPANTIFTIYIICCNRA